MARRRCDAGASERCRVMWQFRCRGHREDRRFVLWMLGDECTAEELAERARLDAQTLRGAGLGGVCRVAWGALWCPGACAARMLVEVR